VAPIFPLHPTASTPDLGCILCLAAETPSDPTGQLNETERVLAHPTSELSPHFKQEPNRIDARLWLFRQRRVRVPRAPTLLPISQSGDVFVLFHLTSRCICQCCRPASGAEWLVERAADSCWRWTIARSLCLRGYRARPAQHAISPSPTFPSAIVTLLPEAASVQSFLISCRPKLARRSRLLLSRASAVSTWSV
jgi:hypothetical protein